MLDATLTEVNAKLAAGDAIAAFQTLRPAIEFPGTAVRDPAELGRALEGFASIATVIVGAEFAAMVRTTASRLDEPQALYDLAYQLYEQRLFGVAATLLARANELSPRTPAILSELSAALEGMRHYGHAAMLLDASGIVDGNAHLAYLAGFNWLMSGGVEEARARLDGMGEVSDDTLRHMRQSLEGMVVRAETLGRAGVDLGEHALTAWHAAINGTLLLHESPHGYDQPMRGRYAYVSDSPGLMREGIERLKAMIGPRLASYGRIVSAPDRASRILALAASQMLGLPLEGDVSRVPSIVVVWEMDSVEDAAFFQALKEHRADQLLFVHAASWLEPFPFAPDVTTLLYQAITHPFLGGALRHDPTLGRVVPAEPDPRDEGTLASEIVAATNADASQTPVERALDVRRALSGLPDTCALGIDRKAGFRTRQRAGSPVQSAFFN